MEIILILVAAISVFGSGLLISTNRLEFGIVVGVLGVAAGVYKEISAHEASAKAEENNRNLIVLSQQQNEKLIEQNEKISRLVSQIDAQKKKLDTYEYEFPGKPILRRLDTVFGLVEITKADCSFEITMHYAKTTNVIERFQIMARLDRWLPEGLIKAVVMDSIPTGDLQDTFEGKRKLTKADGSATFAKDDLIGAALITANLDISEGRHFLTYFFVTPIVLEFRPAPGYENQQCKIGLYDPA